MEILHHHLWPVWRKHALEALYSSVGLAYLAESLIGLFVPIYLHQIGYSLPKILFFFLLSSFYFLIFLKVGVDSVIEWGIRGCMLLSIPFLVAYYLGLRFLEAYPLLFWLLPLCLALRSVWFNFAFHLYFIEHSDRKKRGEEVSNVYSVIHVAALLGPAVGGWILGWSSWGILFGLGSVLLILSVLPLFKIPEKKLRLDFNYRDLWRDFMNPKNGGCVASFMGYAVESFLDRIVWPVLLIMLLLTPEKVGFLVSLSLLSSIAILHMSGWWADHGLRLKLLSWFSYLYSLGWLLRLIVKSGWNVWIVDSFKNMNWQGLTVSWSAYNYDVAGKHFFRFIVFREMVFNLARVILIPMVILVIHFEKGAGAALIIGAVFSVLYSSMSAYHPTLK